MICKLSTASLLVTITSVLFLLAVTVTATAQLYDLKGIGVRSSAMGGAGIASARNGEAIYHNPALLALSEDWTLTLAGQHRTEELDGFGYPDPVSGVTSGSEFALHQASLVVPVAKNVALGLQAGRPLHPVLTQNQWEGGITMYSLSFATSPHPNFCFGATYNIWSGSYTREGDAIPDSPGIDSDNYIYQDQEVSYDGDALAIGIAIPFHIPNTTHQITVAGVYRPAINLMSDGGALHSTFGVTRYLSGGGSFPLGSADGIGLMWRGFNRITVALDSEWRHNQKEDRVYAAPAYPYSQYYTDRYDSDSSWQFRAGVDYELPFDAVGINLRGGYRYHELPIMSDEAENVVSNVFTGGIGIRVSSFRIDAAVEYESYDQPVHYYDWFLQQTINDSVDSTFTTIWLGMTVMISDFF